MGNEQARPTQKVSVKATPEAKVSPKAEIQSTGVEEVKNDEEDVEISPGMVQLHPTNAVSETSIHPLLKAMGEIQPDSPFYVDSRWAFRKAFRKTVVSKNLPIIDSRPILSVARDLQNMYRTCTVIISREQKKIKQNMLALNQSSSEISRRAEQHLFYSKQADSNSQEFKRIHASVRELTQGLKKLLRLADEVNALLPTSKTIPMSPRLLGLFRDSDQTPLSNPMVTPQRNAPRRRTSIPNPADVNSAAGLSTPIDLNLLGFEGAVEIVDSDRLREQSLDNLEDEDGIPSVSFEHGDIEEYSDL